jgi:hypothetical protein
MATEPKLDVTANEPTTAVEAPPQQKPETVNDKFVKKSLTNPMFVEVRPSGKGFVIGGVRPPKLEPKPPSGT